MFQEMVQEPSFILDDKGYVCLDTARIITGRNLELLIAILNSRLFFYSIKTFYGGGSLGNKGIRMKHTFFNQFPCIDFTETTRSKIVDLVKEMSASNKSNSDYLRIIDELIYNEYDLTEDEISVIEL